MNGLRIVPLTGVALVLLLSALNCSGVFVRNTLKSGQTLWQMEWLMSANRKCEAILQENRDFVIFDRMNRRVVWHTGAENWIGYIKKEPVVPNTKRAVVIKLLPSGRLVKTFNDGDYANGWDILWATFSPIRVNTGPYRLELSNDCQLNIFDSFNASIWQNVVRRTEDQEVDYEAQVEQLYEKHKLLRSTTTAATTPTTTYRYQFEYPDDYS